MCFLAPATGSPENVTETEEKTPEISDILSDEETEKLNFSEWWVESTARRHGLIA